MRKKYPFSVINRVMFNPKRSWRDGIEAGDMEHLERYRYRFHVFLSSLALLFAAYLAIIVSIG